MKQFFETYCDKPELGNLLRENTWSNKPEFYKRIMPLLKAHPFYERKLEPCFLEKVSAPMHCHYTKRRSLISRRLMHFQPGLIDEKQWDEAYGVAGQLLSLLPDDLDILRMKQEILRRGAKV